MANIILQHFDGNLRPLDKLSVENIKQYAKLVGAEYELVTGKPFRKHLTAPCQKVFMLDEKYDDYDQVLMLDIDMFAPKGMTENVFDLDGVGINTETQQRLHREIIGRYSLIANPDYPYWGGAIYKMDKALRQKLRSALGGNEGWMNNYNRNMHYEDEGIMHSLAFMSNAKIKNPYLDRRWCQCSFLPNPEKAGFIHMRTKRPGMLEGSWDNGGKVPKIENYEELVRRNIL